MVASSRDIAPGRDRSSFAYVDAAGYSIIAPVAPQIERATGASPSSMGMLVAMFPLGIVVGFMVAAVGVRRDRMQQVLLGSGDPSVRARPRGRSWSLGFALTLWHSPGYPVSTQRSRVLTKEEKHGEGLQPQAPR